MMDWYISVYKNLHKGELRFYLYQIYRQTKQKLPKSYFDKNDLMLFYTFWLWFKH